jgi:sugar phosphate permease
MSTDLTRAAEVTAVSFSYRWLILLLAWACYLMSSVDRFAWGALSLLAREELKLTLPQVGMLVTAYFVGYLVSNCIGGVLTDRFGARLTLSAAVIGTGLFTAGFGLCNSYWLGLALQFAMGLATGADYAGCIKIVTAWFERRQRGRAMGLWFTSTSLGVIIANSAVLALARVLDWRAAYLCLGIVTVAMGAVALVFLRDGSDESKQRKPPLRILALLRNRDLMLVSFAGFGALWATWGFTFSANTLMVQGAGISQAVAGAVVATFGVGGLIAKPLIGFVSDWLGGRRKWLAILCLAGLIAMLLVFASIRSATGFFLAGPLLGVMAFVYSPLLAAMVAESVSRDSTGTASGLSNAFWQLGGVLVPVTVGYVFSQTHSFTVPFVVLALGPLLSILCLIPVRESAEGPVNETRRSSMVS